MGSAFPRSERVIQRDSLRPGLVILVLLMFMFFAWALWMMLFPIPFYVTSDQAQITSNAMVVADFVPEALVQIQLGQTARFIPDSTDLSEERVEIAAVVDEIDVAQGRIWLTLPNDPSIHRVLAPELLGQVRVVVQEQTPFALLLQAAGRP